MVNEITNYHKYIIMAVIVMLASIGFAVMHAEPKGEVGVWQDSAELQDNSVVADKYAGNVDMNKSLSNSLNNSKDNDTFYVTEDDNGNYIFHEYGVFDNETNKTIDNASFKISGSLLKQYIKLEDGDTIVNYWYNKNFNLNGFTKYFEAYLIYNKDWHNYKLVYRIGKDVFVINDLKYVKASDANNYELQTLNFHYGAAHYVTYLQFFGNKSKAKLFISSPINIADIPFSNTNPGWLKYVKSLVIINDKNNIYIDMEVGGYLGNAPYIYARTRYISNTGYNNGSLNYIGAKFSIDDLNKYSKDSIAQLGNTRTLGFTHYTFVKQEFSNGYNGFANRYFKIIGKEDFDKILENNKDQLTSFMYKIATSNLDEKDFDKSFDINFNNESYNFDKVEGIISQGGYINGNDMRNGTLKLVEQYNINTEGYNGLSMNDQGAATLTGKQVLGFGFGDVKGNFDLQAHGRFYFVGMSLWQRALGVVWNILSFDFSGVSQYWNQYVDNPRITSSNTAITDKPMLFSLAFKDSNARTMTITTQKPLEDLLTYNGKKYWLFYVMTTDSDVQKGCIIFDMYVNNLDIRIPVSICGHIVAGSNSISQFKISNGKAGIEQNI